MLGPVTLRGDRILGNPVVALANDLTGLLAFLRRGSPVTDDHVQRIVPFNS